MPRLRTSSTLLLAGGTALLSVVSAVTALDRRPATLSDDGASRADVVLVEPTRLETDLARPVRVRLRWEPAVDVPWPGAEGTITQIQIGPGSVIESGTPIATVDDVGVLALQMTPPPYRDLGPGDRGPDVLGLTEALADLGLLDRDDVSDRYTSSVSAAMRLFNEGRLDESNRLSRDHTMWIADPVVVGSVTLRLGSSAPGRGEPAAATMVSLREATVVPLEGRDAQSADLLTAVASADYVLDVDDDVVSVGSDGVVADLSPFAEVAEETEFIDDVTVRLAEPLQTVQIPASAVITSPVGGLCVVTADGEEIAVEIIDGSPGRVQVDLESDDSIVANPVVLDPVPECDASS